MYRRLTTDDTTAYRALRLAGLQECPTAFGSSFAEELALSDQDFAQQLMPGEDGCVIGAFDDDQLVGVVGVQQNRFEKMRHKAFVWGMYVASARRGAHVGRNPLNQALQFAGRLSGVSQVTLWVVRENQGACALYARAGFVTYGTEPAALQVANRFYDELLMVKFLGNSSAS
ncbi:GNAT family N-acetyltransferase [Salinisphaera sp. C84B14]|uniref:GNAT family N-acetyltransferase n=1 Tax=Salinisphaera sp. C84B14 TaxID=1304155 RepID=UPI00333E5BF3